MRQILFLASLALVVGAPATAQEVYKWKDAKGVTHYSEAPPAKGAYTTQGAVRDPATAQSQGAEAEKPAVDSRCTTARGNLAALQRKGAVQRDNDNDGKPDQTLTDAERDGEIELARATLKAYNCSETTA